MRPAVSALRHAGRGDLAPLPSPRDRPLSRLRQRLRAPRRRGVGDRQCRVRRGRGPELSGVVWPSRPPPRARLLRVGAASLRASRRAHDRRRRGTRRRGGSRALTRDGRDRRGPVAVGGSRAAALRAARHATAHRGGRGRVLRRRAHERHARARRRHRSRSCARSAVCWCPVARSSRSRSRTTASGASCCASRGSRTTSLRTT